MRTQGSLEELVEMFVTLYLFHLKRSLIKAHCRQYGALAWNKVILKLDNIMYSKTPLTSNITLFIQKCRKAIIRSVSKIICITFVQIVTLLMTSGDQLWCWMKKKIDQLDIILPPKEEINYCLLTINKA